MRIGGNGAGTTDFKTRYSIRLTQLNLQVASKNQATARHRG
jgi:hypothetical protein